MYKCKCDVCGKLIWQEVVDNSKARTIRYWHCIRGSMDNNKRKVDAIENVCSVDCCMKFTAAQEKSLSNPFSEYYFEVIPVKVLAEAGELM